MVSMDGKVLWAGSISVAGEVFTVFDASARIPCTWTETHAAQGFARQASTASFLVSFGVEADVTVREAAFVSQGLHARVIEVFMRLPTGQLVIEGIEEFRTGRFVAVPTGVYKVVVAQGPRDMAERLEIDIFLERAVALAPSRILVTDGIVPVVLADWAELATPR
jgi:hypothetical protein